VAAEEKIISDIEGIIDSKVESWSKSMPKIEEDIYNELVRLTGELEEINGRIKPSVKNVKTIGKIKAILTKLIFDKKYDKELQDVVDTLDEITKLQNKYFTQVNKKFKVPNVVKEVQQLSIDGVISQLGKSGLDANILSPLRDILVKNVNSGGTKKEFLEQAKAFITKTEGGEGRLSRYTKQIVTDSLNQYSANYNAIISDDLGYEWFIYSGSNKDTTREFCRAITECKDLRYIHRSQFNDLLEGKICNTTIKLNKKTGLPDGMIEGTNTLNFHTNRGGYNCNHQLTGVPTAIVPKEYLDKIQRKEEVKVSKEEKKKVAIPDEFLLIGLDIPQELFQLSDADKKSNLKIKSDSGSYYDPDSDTVVLAYNTERAKYSEVYKKNVATHEYGHRIHVTKGIFNTEMFEKVYNPKTGEVEFRERTELQKKHLEYFEGSQKIFKEKYFAEKYIEALRDIKVDNLMEKYSEKFPDIKERDLREYVLSYTDTIQSLTKGGVGEGHAPEYWNQQNGAYQTAEWFAHASEIHFIGNPIFEAEFPELYEYMKKYYKKEVIDAFIEK